jgi:hypothetical protein
MNNAPQREQATKALPHVDSQIVAACEQQNPNFGKVDSASQPAVKPSGK